MSLNTCLYHKYWSVKLTHTALEISRITNVQYQVHHNQLCYLHIQQQNNTKKTPRVKTCKTNHNNSVRGSSSLNIPIYSHCFTQESPQHRLLRLLSDLFLFLCFFLVQHSPFPTNIQLLAEPFCIPRTTDLFHLLILSLTLPRYETLFKHHDL